MLGSRLTTSCVPSVEPPSMTMISTAFQSWARALAIASSTMSRRLKVGMTIEKVSTATIDCSASRSAGRWRSKGPDDSHGHL